MHYVMHYVMHILIYIVTAARGSARPPPQQMLQTARGVQTPPLEVAMSLDWRPPLRASRA